MPVFALIGKDSQQGLELRKVHREAHLEGLQKLSDQGRLHYAGPLLDGEGSPTGSVVIFEDEDLKLAMRTASSDPYIVHGVFESYEIQETKVVFPKGNAS